MKHLFGYCFSGWWIVKWRLLHKAPVPKPLGPDVEMTVGCYIVVRWNTYLRRLVVLQHFNTTVADLAQLLEPTFDLEEDFDSFGGCSGCGNTIHSNRVFIVRLEGGVLTYYHPGCAFYMNLPEGEARLAGKENQ
jgi:hypothetical protein